MLSLGAIDALSWVLWCLAGLVVGLLCGLYLNGRRLLWVNLAVGLLAGLAGGVSTVLATGGMGQSTLQLIISVMTALFLAAVVLWLLNAALRRR